MNRGNILEGNHETQCGLVENNEGLNYVLEWKSNKTVDILINKVFFRGAPFAYNIYFVDFQIHLANIW